MSTAGTRHWLEQHPLAGAVLLAVVPAIAAIAGGSQLSDVELKKVLYTGAGTLTFGGLLGGMIKLVLDEVAASKRRREDEVAARDRRLEDAAGFVNNVLRDLKAVHDRTAQARLLIAAHRSADTYGKELRALVEAKVELLNVIRALGGRADGVADEPRKVVAAAAQRMSDYLGELIDEFRDRYKELSDLQRNYEARATVTAKSFGEATAEDRAPPPMPAFVWEGLATLPRLTDLLASGPGYTGGFLKPLDKASKELRDELARVLRGEPAD